jgi:hypothetical protein
LALEAQVVRLEQIMGQRVVIQHLQAVLFHYQLMVVVLVEDTQHLHLMPTITKWLVVMAPVEML